jgi:hypothetical protein
MSDRLSGVIVTFEKDMRDDDAQELITAIQCIRNVASVDPVVVNSSDWINRQQVRHELRMKLFKVLESE